VQIFKIDLPPFNPLPMLEGLRLKEKFKTVQSFGNVIPLA
jgi:hypothetical protein